MASALLGCENVCGGWLSLLVDDLASFLRPELRYVQKMQPRVRGGGLRSRTARSCKPSEWSSSFLPDERERLTSIEPLYLAVTRHATTGSRQSPILERIGREFVDDKRELLGC